MNPQAQGVSSPDRVCTACRLVKHAAGPTGSLSRRSRQPAEELSSKASWRRRGWWSEAHTLRITGPASPSLPSSPVHHWRPLKINPHT